MKVRSAVVVAMLASAPMSAGAQETCPVPEGASPSLAAVDAKARLRFIRHRLRRDATNARTWSVGWGITSVAVTATTFTLAAFESDPDSRTCDYVWGGASLLPAAILLLFPLRVMRDSRTLEGSSETPEGASTCGALAQAEEFLERDANQEASGIAWYSHALVIGFNLGLGASLGYALDDWGNNAVSAGIGIALSETQILTQPLGAVRARERYRSGDLGPTQDSPDSRDEAQWRLRLTPLVVPHARGVAIAASF